MQGKNEMMPLAVKRKHDQWNKRLILILLELRLVAFQV